MKLNRLKFSSLINVSCRQAKQITTALTLPLMFLISVAPASAQVLERPTVSRPLDIFDGISDKFIVGERTVLKIRNERAKRVVGGGLQARIFTLNDSQSRPDPVDEIDKCNVFLSIVLNLTSIDGEHIALPAMDHRWLSLTDSLNKINPGRYFLVFEKRGPNSNEFRLKTGDEDDYFNNGFVFTVSASKEITVEMVRTAYFERRDQLGELRREIGDKSRKVPCYTYRKLASSIDLESDLLQASLDLCEPDNQFNSASSVPLNISVHPTLEKAWSKLHQP